VTEQDRPLPAWLRALLTAHRTGSSLRAITTGGPAGLSRAELGGLLRGAKPISEAVFRFRYLGHKSEWERVFTALSGRAEAMKGHPEFSAVHCDDCLTRLVALVLAEEQLADHTATAIWRARYMGVSRGTWRYRYDKPHIRLKQEIERWANDAVGAIQRNLKRETQ
jgi:hypothetical protein